MNEEKKVVELRVSDVLPNRFQPRIKFNETSINELADSIKEHGVIQPIVVRTIGDKYEIIAGERRYKASVLAGKESIPAIVTSLNDKDSAEVALIENVQRQDLTPIEEAISYKKILDMGYLTQEQLAIKLGKNQSTIANKIRLLNLDEDVQEALLDEKISERHARSLLKLTDSETQRGMLNKILTERLTVRRTDEEISKLLKGEISLPSSSKNEIAEESENTNVKPIEILDYANSITENKAEEPKMDNINDFNMPINPIVEEPIEIKEEPEITKEIPNVEKEMFNEMPSNDFTPDFLNNIPEVNTFGNNEINEPEIPSIEALPEMPIINEENASEPLDTSMFDGMNFTSNLDTLDTNENNFGMPTSSIIEEEEPINLEANNIANNTFDINPGFVDVDKIENEAEDIYKEKPLADLDSLLKSDIIPGLNDLQKPEVEEKPIEVEPVPQESKFKFFNFNPEEVTNKEESKDETETNPFNFNPIVTSTEPEVPVIENTYNTPNVEISESADQAVDVNALYGLTPEEPKVEEIQESEEITVEPEAKEELPEVNFVENIEDQETNMNFGENIFNQAPVEQSNLDFNKFYDPAEDKEVETTEEPKEEPKTINYPEDNSMAESVKKPEEVIVASNGEPEEAKADLKPVINLIRECSDKIEKYGYYIDTEEFDFEDIYQVIFKINKN